MPADAGGPNGWSSPAGGGLHRGHSRPRFGHMKRSAITDKAFPLGFASDRIDKGVAGWDAERGIRRAIAEVLRPLGERANDFTIRLKFGADRVHSDLGTTLIELKSEKIAGIGRK